MKTKRQKKEWNLINLLESISGGKSEQADQLRAKNRRIEMKKGRTR